MQKYIALMTFTEKGAKELSKTAARSDSFERVARQKGVKILHTFWVNGPFDVIHIFEVENDQAAMAHSFSISSLGNLKTQTFRAYTKKEILPILQNISTPYDLLNAE